MNTMTLWHVQECVEYKVQTNKIEKWNQLACYGMVGKQIRDLTIWISRWIVLRWWSLWSRWLWCLLGGGVKILSIQFLCLIDYGLGKNLLGKFGTQGGGESWCWRYEQTKTVYIDVLTKPSNSSINHLTCNWSIGQPWLVGNKPMI